MKFIDFLRFRKELEEKIKMSEEDFTEVEQVPESAEEATIHNQNNRDPLGMSVSDHNNTRRAEGTIDGYNVVISCVNEIHEEERKYVINIYTSASAYNDKGGNKSKGKFDERFTAEAVFEKLVRRYELEEKEFGFTD